MKTIANIAIIGLASALRIREEGRQAEEFDTTKIDVDHCAKIAEIPEDATWDDISAMITAETGEVMEEAEFNAIVTECFGEDAGAEDDDADAIEGQSSDSTDEDGPMGGSDTSSIYAGSSDGSLTSDEDEAGPAVSVDADAASVSSLDDDVASVASLDDDAASVSSLDDDVASVTSVSSVDTVEDNKDQLFEDSDDSNDSEEEFAYWCQRINELPEDAAWEDVEAGLIEEFGEDAPAYEEFIAVSWACGAVEHGTEFINDFEDVCDTIAEEVPEGATYADVVEFLTQELGDDAPTEEEWNAINWACDAAAEYGEDYYGEDYYGEDDSTPVPTTEAQIKDEDMTEDERPDHCGDLAHLDQIGVTDGDWESILAYIVENHGEEGAPTEKEFYNEVAFCATKAPQGSAQPHGDDLAQTKEDHEGPTEEEVIGSFDPCEVFELIPEDAHWT